MPYAPGMTIRPLGWELTAVLVSAAALVVALALDLEGLAGLVLQVLAVLTPVILVSLVIRLTAGIIAEHRRHRLSKAVTAVRSQKCDDSAGATL